MRLRKGQLVAIRFLDHVEGGMTPLTFCVYGRIVSISKESLTVRSWEYCQTVREISDHPVRDLKDANLIQHVIIRGAIKKITHLEERE